MITRTPGLCVSVYTNDEFLPCSSTVVRGNQRKDTGLPGTTSRSRSRVRVLGDPRVHGQGQGHSVSTMRPRITTTSQSPTRTLGQDRLLPTPFQTTLEDLLHRSD